LLKSCAPTKSGCCDSARSLPGGCRAALPVPTFPIHEGRIADRLPAFQLDGPSLEYIQVSQQPQPTEHVVRGHRGGHRGAARWAVPGRRRPADPAPVNLVGHQAAKDSTAATWWPPTRPATKSTKRGVFPFWRPPPAPTAKGGFWTPTNSGGWPSAKRCHCESVTAEPISFRTCCAKSRRNGVC
jgi:hypothetical protein